MFFIIYCYSFFVEASTEPGALGPGICTKTTMGKVRKEETCRSAGVLGPTFVYDRYRLDRKRDGFRKRSRRYICRTSKISLCIHRRARTRRSGLSANLLNLVFVSIKYVRTAAAEGYMYTHTHKYT